MAEASAEQEALRAKMEENLIAQEYKIWKKNTPFLYDFVMTVSSPLHRRRRTRPHPGGRTAGDRRVGTEDTQVRMVSTVGRPSRGPPRSRSPQWH